MRDLHLRGGRRCRPFSFDLDGARSVSNTESLRGCLRIGDLLPDASPDGDWIARCYLLATIERLWNSTQHYRRAFMETGGPGRAWVINAEHRLLLDALRQGDSEGAELHLLGHIRRTRRELSAAHDLFQ